MEVSFYYHINVIFSQLLVSLSAYGDVPSPWNQVLNRVSHCMELDCKEKQLECMFLNCFYLVLLFSLISECLLCISILVFIFPLELCSDLVFQYYRVVKKYPHDSWGMQLVSKYFVSENVYDDSSSDMPKQRWRLRNFFSANLDSFQRTVEDSYENATHLEGNNMKKPTAGEDSFVSRRKTNQKSDLEQKKVGVSYLLKLNHYSTNILFSLQYLKAPMHMCCHCAYK